MKNPLRQGESFSLQLQLPGLLEPVNAKCQVAWVRDPHTLPPGMGVKFIEMPAKDREVLVGYIKTIEKMGIKIHEMSEKDSLILQQYLKMITDDLNTTGREVH